MTHPVLLSADSLSKTFNGFTANKDICLTLLADQLTAIIGPNGAGKSTLFNMLSGSLSPSSGRLVFEGRDISGEPHHRFVHFGISKSHQITSLFLDSTVAENVFCALEAPARALNLWDVRDSRSERVDEVFDILDLVGLAPKGATPAHKLSHGEQRALEIGVALASRPKLLLLDEPTAGMGPQETMEVIALIKRLRQRFSIAIVEHKMKLVMEISDRIIVLHHGEVLAQGTPNEIAGNSEVKAVYLGDKYVAQ